MTSQCALLNLFRTNFKAANSAALSLQCPLCAKSGHRSLKSQCPLQPQKRTIANVTRMSAKCQNRTWDELNLSAIPSLRRWWRATPAATVRPSAFAVLRLATVSYLVSRFNIGRSSPSEIPARRMPSSWSRVEREKSSSCRSLAAQARSGFRRRCTCCRHSNKNPPASVGDQ